MPGFEADFQYTVQYSVPYDTESGRYYWTNVYYFHRGAGTPPYLFQVNALTGATFACISAGVRHELYRVWDVGDPPDDYVQVITGDSGSIPGTDRILLTNAVRVESVAEGGRLWYKRLRGLLRASDIADGVVSSSILGYLNGSYFANLANVALRNSNYVNPGPIVVNRRVRHWQLRHGTHRRGRMVLLPS